MGNEWRRRGRWRVRCSRIRAGHKLERREIRSISRRMATAARDVKSRSEVVARNQSSPPLSKHNKTSDRGKNRSISLRWPRRPDPRVTSTGDGVCVKMQSIRLYGYIGPLCVRLARALKRARSPSLFLSSRAANNGDNCDEVVRHCGKKGTPREPRSRAVARVSGRCMALR